jgi:hypothetical protein
MTGYGLPQAGREVVPPHPLSRSFGRGGEEGEDYITLSLTLPLDGGGLGWG